MRLRIVCGVGAMGLALASVAALSLGRAQERVQPPAPGAKSAPPARPDRDLSRLSFAQKQAYLSAQRGLDWLQRHNRADGHFGYVSVPALRKRSDNDHFLNQAGATVALARAARFFQDERAAALATQSVLTLLLDTAPDDPKKPTLRHTTVPNTAIHRLASTGLLLLAIHELPSPPADLLDASDQLCQYLRRQQRPDGSLTCADNPNDAKPSAEDVRGDDAFAGIALYGLIRGQQHRPAAWKTEALKKAQRYYHERWRAHKNLAVVPGLSAAWAEAYLLTKEQAFATSIFEMNDWLCTLQYQQLDPHRPLWVGGFMSWVDGKAVPSAPRAGSARYGEALAHACRAARQAGDAQRHERYRDALERCVSFAVSLQYTQANTQHFADWYRDEVLGAFHISHEDGNLKLEDTSQAVGTLILCLTYVANLP
jgi:hypothetical protein